MGGGEVDLSRTITCGSVLGSVPLIANAVSRFFPVSASPSPGEATEEFEVDM